MNSRLRNTLLAKDFMKYSVNGYNNVWSISFPHDFYPRNILLTAGHNVYKSKDGRYLRPNVLIGKARDPNWKVPTKYFEDSDKRFDIAFTRDTEEHPKYNHFNSSQKLNNEVYIITHLNRDYKGKKVEVNDVRIGIFPTFLNESPGSNFYEFPIGFKGISGAAVINCCGEFIGIVCGLGVSYGNNGEIQRMYHKETNKGLMIPTKEIIRIINNETTENISEMPLQGV